MLIGLCLEKEAAGPGISEGKKNWKSSQFRAFPKNKRHRPVREHHEMLSDVKAESEAGTAPVNLDTPAPNGYSATTPSSAGRGKGSQTPSPSTSASNGQSSNSRRPPRKSTLTQQQKNQKRQRATQDQLTTLEMEFNKNPTPTAGVRERIADEINMTERSVQIWFQNR